VVASQNSLQAPARTIQQRTKVAGARAEIRFRIHWILSRAEMERHHLHQASRSARRDRSMVSG